MDISLRPADRSTDQPHRLGTRNNRAPQLNSSTPRRAPPPAPGRCGAPPRARRGAHADSTDEAILWARVSKRRTCVLLSNLLINNTLNFEIAPSNQRPAGLEKFKLYVHPPLMILEKTTVQEDP